MKYLIILFLSLSQLAFSQDDLLSEIDSDSTRTSYATAAFKGLKIVGNEILGYEPFFEIQDLLSIDAYIYLLIFVMRT